MYNSTDMWVAIVLLVLVMGYVWISRSLEDIDSRFQQNEDEVHKLTQKVVEVHDKTIDNANDISDLNGTVDTNTTSIGINTTSIVTNKTNIGIEYNQTGIQSLQQQITDINNTLEANSGEVDTIGTAVALNATHIGLNDHFGPTITSPNEITITSDFDHTNTALYVPEMSDSSTIVGIKLSLPLAKDLYVPQFGHRRKFEVWSNQSFNDVEQFAFSIVVYDDKGNETEFGVIVNVVGIV